MMLWDLVISRGMDPDVAENLSIQRMIFYHEGSEYYKKLETNERNKALNEAMGG